MGEAFGSLFRTFEHTAYRLETLDEYTSANETAALRQFVAGEAVDMGWFQKWLSLISQASAEGRRFSRVRVVSLPLTDYSRFGVFCSSFTNAVGEQTRYVARDAAADLPAYDYWLFDSRLLVRMHFDDAQDFLGGEVIEDPAAIVIHNYWRDVAWHRSVPRGDIAAE